MTIPNIHQYINNRYLPMNRNEPVSYPIFIVTIITNIYQQFPPRCEPCLMISDITSPWSTGLRVTAPYSPSPLPRSEVRTMTLATGRKWVAIRCHCCCCGGCCCIGINQWCCIATLGWSWISLDYKKQLAIIGWYDYPTPFNESHHKVSPTGCCC